MLKEAKIASIVSLFPLPQYVVVLEDTEKTRLVPIWIGVSEGAAIALEMQGEKFPRPLTHDLMVNIIKSFQATVNKVVVSDIRDNSYFAIIDIQCAGRSIELDARPSDSLALAVRVHCPIFIDEKVLNKCPKIEKLITEEDIEKFKETLKTMTPEEFFKNLEEAPLESDHSMGEFYVEGMPETEGDEEIEEDEGEEEENA